MAPPSDEASKERIIAHMNKDHPDSLSRFLEVYAGVSHFSARSPKLEDLTLSSMRISSASTTKIIPISPPLSSLSESRSRLVAMHEECGQKLGRDPITLTRFRWPGLVHLVILGGVFLGLVLWTDGRYFAPGSFLARTLFRPAPALARIMEQYHWYFWWAVLGIHVGEAGFMATVLKKYNVQPLSKVWTLYVLFTALEGYGCMARLKAEVRREKAIKQRKQEKEGLH